MFEVQRHVPTEEGPMFGKSIRSSMVEPPFFFLAMAATCIRRAASTCHPNGSGALRDAAREYLAKAGRVIQTDESQSATFESQGCFIERVPSLMLGGRDECMNALHTRSFWS